MLLKSDFICLNSLGWQEGDSSTGITVALFLGHSHKPSFHLLLRMEVSFLFGLFFKALAQSKLVLFLVTLQQTGINFAAIYLKSLVQMSSHTI